MPARRTCRCSHRRWRTSKRSSQEHDAIFVGGGNTRSLLALWSGMEARCGPAPRMAPRRCHRRRERRDDRVVRVGRHRLRSRRTDAAALSALAAGLGVPALRQRAGAAADLSAPRGDGRHPRRTCRRRRRRAAFRRRRRCTTSSVPAGRPARTASSASTDARAKRRSCRGGSTERSAPQPAAPRV